MTEVWCWLFFCSTGTTNKFCSPWDISDTDQSTSRPKPTVFISLPSKKARSIFSIGSGLTRPLVYAPNGCYPLPSAKLGQPQGYTASTDIPPPPLAAKYIHTAFCLSGCFQTSTQMCFFALCSKAQKNCNIAGVLFFQTSSSKHLIQTCFKNTLIRTRTKCAKFLTWTLRQTANQYFVCLCNSSNFPVPVLTTWCWLWLSVVTNQWYEKTHPDLMQDAKVWTSQKFLQAHRRTGQEIDGKS